MQNEAAVGKAKGGNARALILSPSRRKEISELALKAKRERSALPKAVCGSDDRMIVFGDIEIQCYVLEDETRSPKLEVAAKRHRHVRGGR